MNVYLACTVRGDRSALESTRAIAATITALGHTLLTAHLLEDDVEAAESALSERDVFERDLRWLSGADVLIAEASGSKSGTSSPRPPATAAECYSPTTRRGSRRCRG